MFGYICKIWRNIYRDKFKALGIIIMWLLFGVSAVAILNKIGIIDSFLGYSPHAEGINEVIHNLSYSYMAGLIFYMINDWFPRKMKERNARLLLSIELKELKLYLGKINKILKFKESINNINSSGNRLCGSFWIKTETGNIEYVNMETYLAGNSSKALSLLTKIIESPIFGDVNKSFANTIVNIKSNRFINSTKESGFMVAEVDDFIKVYCQLEDYLFIPTDNSHFTIPSQYECDQKEANIKIKQQA